MTEHEIPQDLIEICRRLRQKAEDAGQFTSALKAVEVELKLRSRHETTEPVIIRYVNDWRHGLEISDDDAPPE
jgi:L-fucose isomerase-like protein